MRLTGRALRNAMHARRRVHAQPEAGALPAVHALALQLLACC